jgi:gag-polypeptide of LTR copia-type
LDDPSVIWSALKVQFESNKSEKKVIYLAKLKVMSFHKGKESVQDFVSRIRRKVKDIKTLRGSLLEVQITRYFIQGLPSAYNLWKPIL